MITNALNTKEINAQRCIRLLIFVSMTKRHISCHSITDISSVNHFFIIFVCSVAWSSVQKEGSYEEGHQLQARNNKTMSATASKEGREGSAGYCAHLT